MSRDWPADIAAMHTKFGVNEVVRSMDTETKRKFLDFRINFIEEELNELREASSGEKMDVDGIVDALIDICVVAIGTLNAFDVNPHLAWNEVHKANMSKEVGVKEGRPNPLGLPDLIKPEDWEAPSHINNTGILQCYEFDDDYGDLMTLDEFVDSVNCGFFVDYDGFGMYSDGKVVYEVMAIPSHVNAGLIHKNFTHVLWYNR